MPGIHRFLTLCLVMTALSTPIAQAVAQEVITVEIGEVGQPALDFSWAGSQESRVDLKFADNKSLSDGSGLLIFELASSSPRTYTGFLQDAAGRKIPGTDFSGTSNLVPANLDLEPNTVWSGMRFDVGGGTTMPPSTLTWITTPTVGQPAGNQGPTADPGGTYAGAADVDIQFDGSGSSDPDGQITDYKWFFGDGKEGTGEKPVHRYELGGRYTVVLTVTDDGGTRDSATTVAQIGLNDAPPTAFAGGGAEGYTGTVNVPIQFDGSRSRDDVGIDSYSWNWQDGSGSPSGSGVMPQHAYPFSGSYTVILTVTDTSGQTDQDSNFVIVAGGNQPPVADAGPPVSGKVGDPVSFDATGSSDAEGEITEYAWNFGDGTDTVTDAGATPSYTYSEPGTYTVTVIVTDPDDPSVTDSDFTTAYIVDGNQLPSAEANGPYTGSVGVPVEFQATGSSDPDGSIQDYFWLFDDGNTGEGATASHTYTEGGNYQATLIVTDNDGASAVDYATVSIDSDNLPPRAVAGGPYPGIPGATVAFNGTDSFDPDGEIVSYSWDFGDSGSGSGAQPTHTYAIPGVYYVILTTVDDDGATAQDLTLAVIGRPTNLPPTAEAGGPYTGTAGAPVSFDGSGSSDDDGIVTYEWQWGDEGSSSFGEQVDHTYAAPGFYHVTLTVTDAQGLTSSDGTIAIIGSDSAPPTADAGGPYTGTSGAVVRFDGTGSSDPDGEIASWEWEFGDESGPAGGPTPRHTYDAPGTYLATLTVTDFSGETARDTATVQIAAGNLPPTADTGGPYIGTAGVAKRFDGGGSADPDGDIVSYAWEFGDSGSGTGAVPLHTYGAPGQYHVTLTVTDDDGVSASSTTVALIGEPDPAPDDRLLDVVTLDNVGGGPDADLAVLDVGLATGDQVSAVIHMRDGGTGEEIYQVELPDVWQSVALDAVDDFSGPLLAILQRGPDGSIRVQSRNATDGTFNSNIAYFDNTWTPIDLLAISDAGGPGVPGIGVLAENLLGQQAIEVHKVGNGELVSRVFYFNDVWTPSGRSVGAIDLGEFNGNGYSELAVLATNNAGKHAVETRDVLSGKQISRYFFLGPTNTVIGLADVADVSGNSRPEIVVLGNKDASDSTANTIQAKDVKTGELISKVGTYGPDFTGLGIRSIGDVDGNGFEEVVVAALNGVDNTTSVSVRDIAANSLTRKTGFLGPAYDPRDVEVLNDVSGNSIQEVVVLGLDSGDLSIRVQLRDALTGALIRNIDLN